MWQIYLQSGECLMWPFYCKSLFSLIIKVRIYTFIRKKPIKHSLHSEFPLSSFVDIIFIISFLLHSHIFHLNVVISLGICPMCGVVLALSLHVLYFPVSLAVFSPENRQSPFSEMLKGLCKLFSNQALCIFKLNIQQLFFNY